MREKESGNSLRREWVTPDFCVKFEFDFGEFEKTVVIITIHL